MARIPVDSKYIHTTIITFKRNLILGYKSTYLWSGMEMWLSCEDWVKKYIQVTMYISDFDSNATLDRLVQLEDLTLSI